MRHRIEPTESTTVDVMSAVHTPVLSVEPGESVIVRTLDSHGHLKPQTYPGEPLPKRFPELRGHCLVGPIEVRGAQPGQVLAVTFRTLEPDTWGFTNAGGRTNRLYRRLRLDGVDQVSLLWTIDATKGFASNQYGHQVPLNPFLGVVGVGLPEGEHSTIPPRALGGGNIDCKDLIAGSTLFLPIQTGGAMLYVGDGHGAQGDGEVGGSAMECGMTTEMVLDVIDAGPIDSIHAVTPTSRITFGFDEDLNEAMASALDAMVKWMSGTLGLESAAALALASCTVDLRVTQVANDTWGVHAALPNERITMDDRGDRAADA